MSTQTINRSGLNPHVSVDCVVFGFDFEEIKVLLIQRNLDYEPQSNVQMNKANGTASKVGVNGTGSEEWALPGDLIQDIESLDQAANRVLQELTGLEKIYLEQFKAFGSPDRVRRASDAAWLEKIREKPDARVITVAYFSLMKIDGFEAQPSSFAKRVEWFSLADVPELAFDHADILAGAKESLKLSLRRRPIGFELLPKKFTLGQLQKLYESILVKSLDKRNFRKKILKSGILISLNEKQKGVPHKPAQYYSFDTSRYNELRSTGFDFYLLE